MSPISKYLIIKKLKIRKNIVKYVQYQVKWISKWYRHFKIPKQLTEITQCIQEFLKKTENGGRNNKMANLGELFQDAKIS